MATTVARGHQKKKAVSQCCPSVLSSPLDAREAEQLARRFTALADPVRLQLLSILAAAPDGEVCICDFVGPVGKSQPTVSHHMKVLADVGSFAASAEANGCTTRLTVSNWPTFGRRSVRVPRTPQPAEQPTDPDWRSSRSLGLPDH